ncbi:glutamate--tRNA ligase [Thermosulfuriphilus ammonigenes]|uniref:Glutamate--tRNA ligase n=1 Tax=Thermosulfuriphilus ammonigenes TaxID=1936021 RepID=A0A6G7PW20_9BACT|nr:glutamate--tRNA ligase [Thermosulfuriphilus ammonigenes]MBA2848029.1 glutamyl-tRNA synthetase [Thermosulfuriphilus ammonigenes]QIJ71787.1 glutamate--tRNA ligase [Thermosulfuriphilus ammonigenes]
MNIKTRFPPSPTGHLHIGGARTALFNWLFARHHGGKFVLRFEDTDQERSRPEYAQAILEAMKWLGLDWDEGPYYQSQRFDLYRQYIDQLLEEGQAYWCQCSPEELEAKRKKALERGQKPKYDGTCRRLGLGPGPGRVVRFKIPPTGSTVVDDLIRGPVAFDHQELDDFIILRSDGVPTYHFAVVIDDLTMEITHVIRGDDHLNNTPKHILLFKALGAQPPKFAHVPMILGPDRTRLSKRHGAMSVLAYRDEGYLPQALINYLVRLGWSYGDQEIFSLQELIEKFSLENIGRSAAVFNPEKLLWLNAHYIKSESPETLASLVRPFLARLGVENVDEGYLRRAIETVQTRAKTLAEMAEMLLFYFKEPDYDPKAAQKFLKPEVLPALERLAGELKELPEFSNEELLEKLFRGLAEEMGLKLKNIAQPVRVALTGKTVSPGLFEIISLLGKERVISRLKRAIEFIKSKEA